MRICLVNTRSDPDPPPTLGAIQLRALGIYSPSLTRNPTPRPKCTNLVDNPGESAYICAMNGEQLKQWREGRGWSKLHVAEVLGCSRNSVRAWESGQKIPDYVALAIAAVQMGLPAYGEEKESRAGSAKNPGGQGDE